MFNDRTVWDTAISGQAERVLSLFRRSGRQEAAGDSAGPDVRERPKRGPPTPAAGRNNRFVAARGLKSWPRNLARVERCPSTRRVLTILLRAYHTWTWTWKWTWSPRVLPQRLPAFFPSPVLVWPARTREGEKNSFWPTFVVCPPSFCPRRTVAVSPARDGKK